MITKMVAFESEEVFSYRSLQFGKKKHVYGENFRYRENICEIELAGGCCSNREDWNVWNMYEIQYFG